MNTIRTTLGVALVASLVSAPASAAWIAPRSTPIIGELVAVDGTGEADWPFGFEDLLGDDIAFGLVEQSLDVRTVYAATDANQLWVRVYVSDVNAAGATVVAYIFIDRDRDVATGGSAAAPTIDPGLVALTNPGGYDYVFAVQGDGTFVGGWSWNAGASDYQVDNLNQNQYAAEAGQDVDPILFGDTAHGYLQGTIDLPAVGLTQQCQARLFVRTVDASGAGPSDLEAGSTGECIPTDGNADGIPDIVVPPSGCTTDAECPLDGICVNGACIFARPCTVATAATDCAADESCVNGSCVANPGGACTDNSDCGALVCTADVCSPCALGGTTCGTGRRCAPDGRCVDDGGGAGGGGVGGGGVNLNPGDTIQGGPCACGVPGGAPASPGAALLAALTAVVFARRSRQGRAVVR